MILLALLLGQIATSNQAEPTYVVVEGVELETLERCDPQVCTGQALTQVIYNPSQSTPELAYQVSYERGRVDPPWSSIDLIFQFKLVGCQSPDSVKLFMGESNSEIPLYERSESYSTSFFPGIYATDDQPIVFKIEGDGPACSGRGEIPANYITSLKTWANTLEQRQPLNGEPVQ